MPFNFSGSTQIPLNSGQPPPPPPTHIGPPVPMGGLGPQQGQMGGGPVMAGQMVHGQMIPGQMMGHMMGPQGFPLGPLISHDGPHPPGSIINPGMNDAPLEFNTNKNKPPMAVHTANIEIEKKSNNGSKEENASRDFKRERDRDRNENSRERDLDADNRQRRDRGRDRERERNDRDRREERNTKEGTNLAAAAALSPSVKSEVSDKQTQSPLESSFNSVCPSGPPLQGSGSGLSPGHGAVPGRGPDHAPGPVPVHGPPPAALGPGSMGPWGGMVGPPMGYPMMGPINPIIGPGMMDPNMMIGQFGMMGGIIGPEGTMIAPDAGAVIPGDSNVAVNATPQQPKEIIHCKSLTLFPPNPTAPPPITRERPPGCKTIFVGGLPENTTEDMIREIFGRCGEMLTVRLSNKKFCHIRFVHESSVDAALYFSGYRMRIGSNTDLPNTGRLHVDFAQARDDQYEWECRQRQLQREQRHRDRVEKERMRVPSPPPVAHYTDREASQIVEKIKSDENFTKAMQVVITWLERGECNKRNSNTFYSMIQSTNSHVRRLLTEKAQYEDELQKAKDLMKTRMQGILIQFSQIERVFISASHKKVWDHFTKPQRKNIKMWRKQATEIKQIELEENLNEGLDEEMEVSDEDEPIRKKSKKEFDTSINSLPLKDENDSLRCQLEAYKNEVDIVKCDLKTEIEQKEKQLKLVQQALQGMQQQLIESKKRQTEDELKVKELQARLEKDQEQRSFSEDKDNDVIYIDCSDSSDSNRQTDKKVQHFSEKDAKLIGLISIFLHVHPFGAGVDYIWSYLHKMDSSIKPTDVESLMGRFPTVFQQELSGIGAHMERRWCFGAFKI